MDEIKRSAAMNVSIIIPVYNVSKYIERCVKSVMSQTFKGQLECLLVDDCTPDDSIAICERLLRSYHGPIKFKILHHDINKGLSEARNTGTRIAKGDYLYYLDSDDEITDDCIELLWEQVIRYPGVEVVMGNTRSDNNQDYYDISYFHGHSIITDSHWLQFHFFSSGKTIPVNAWNKLVKSDFVFRYQLFFMPGIIHEDNHWFFYVIKYVKKWAFVFKETYIHYRNDASIMCNLNLEKSARSWVPIMLDLSTHFYEPFYTLQLALYLKKYLNESLFTYHVPSSRKLHLFFIKACFHKHLWKGVIFLTLFTLLYNIRSGIFAKMSVWKYAKALYAGETKRLKNKNSFMPGPRPSFELL